MDRWQNKIAVITGAGSGIGAATSKVLVEEGMIVVGFDIRLDNMETTVKPSIAADKRQNFHYYKCNVGDEESVKEAFKWVEEKFGGVDVLINNAGLIRTSSILAEDNSQDLRDIINVNVMGVAWCTREAFQSMKKRQFDGHVILINSLAGHKVPLLPGMSFSIYSPSKHAVTAMTEVFRQQFKEEKTKIKVTSISPGGVNTNIMGKDYEMPEGMPILQPADLADAILFSLKAPPHVQIHELTIRSVGELC